MRCNVHMHPLLRELPLEGIKLTVVFILCPNTKHCVKSHGTALVRVRWKFSDKALGFSEISPKF
jgi:hypothetical protein